MLYVIHSSKNTSLKMATTGSQNMEEVLLLLFCRARWLMPLDVPQPVQLIVLTLL
jgi:hypothetical protein